ncbi:MAG: PAS domain S-box protein [Candidatus Competibacteraceae bacterium]|nr:MAG: PAS domain S-box protein [Candidatus Competibacteraceae bacterium]
MNSIRFFTIHILKPLNRFRVSIGRAIEEFCRRLDRDHQSLEEAAALHRAIFESRKIVRILVNPDNGRIVDANQAAADFYGYPRDALRQRPVWDFDTRTPEDTLTLLARLKESQDSPTSIESQHRLANGELRDVAIYPDPIRHQNQVLLLAVIVDITERKQTEQALTDEVTRRRALFEQSRDGIVIVDGNGKVDEANQHYADMLGYSLAETQQLHLWDWDDQWTREVLLSKAAQISATGEQFETRHRRKDGSMIDVEVVSSATESAGRKLILCICRGITERKRAAEQVASLSERLTLATQYAGVGIWDYDVRANRLVWNEAMFALYGISPEQFAPSLETWLSRVHPDDLPRLHGEMRAAIAGSPYDTNFRIVRPDGETRFIKAIAKARRDASDQPLRFVGVNWDITDFKTTEQALRDSEERLQRVLDGANDGCWDWNIATGDVLFNRRWAEMLDYDLADIAPRIEAWQVLVYPDDWSRCQTDLQRHFNGETPQYQCEYRIRAKNGEWRWVLDRGKLTRRDANGQPLWMAGTHTDVHDRHCMEETLHKTLAELRRHNVQIAAANRMDNSLLSCETAQEAYEIIAHGAEILFADHAGGLAVREDDAPALRWVARWGNDRALPPALPLVQCRAFRGGEPQEVIDSGQDVCCLHFLNQPAHLSFCLPLMVRGDILGLLHIGAGHPLSKEQLQELRNLAIKLGESIKLALSNLKLRATLREQAIRDPLTGLFNRRYLDETLPRELSRCQRGGEPLTVAMLDLDHFKHFNDNYGHEAGDVVLRAVGGLLRQSLRGGDIACRYGGEELVLILSGATLADTRARLEKLRRAVMQLHPSFRGSGELPAITVSVGLAVARSDETDAAALLGRADAALYRAKEQGRNRVVALDREPPPSAP